MAGAVRSDYKRPAQLLILQLQHRGTSNGRLAE